MAGKDGLYPQRILSLDAVGLTAPSSPEEARIVTPGMWYEISMQKKIDVMNNQFTQYDMFLLIIQDSVTENAKKGELVKKFPQKHSPRTPSFIAITSNSRP